jgi:type IV pilus assembly protein PilB
VAAERRRSLLTRGRDDADGSAVATASIGRTPDQFDIAADGKRLGELLLRAGAIKESVLRDALLRQLESGRRIGELLADMGVIDERALVEALAAQNGLKVIDLRDAKPQANALQALPESLARELSVVPLAQDDGRLYVAAAEPLNREDAERVADAAKMPILVVLARPTEVRRLIDSRYRVIGDVDRHIEAFEATARTRTAAQTETAPRATEDEAPVVQVVHLLLTQALRDRASDVHIEPQDTQVRVRFRIDGALHEVSSLPVNMGPALVSRIKIMAGMNIVERRRSQDGQINIEIDNRPVDIRVATTATIWGEKCVMRILDKGRSMLRLADLGMNEETHETMSRLIRSPFGMVLCAGPTGSGKTTTLYASLAEIDEPNRNIMTIEDPVEYVMPTVNQIQTNEAAGLTFASGLKSILRQDPDVILVGEIRDVETARIATQSALTGHFVLSTLHATDSVAALHRLLDMGIESFLIASSVIAVVGQRLVRRVCKYCKAPYTPTAEEMAFYEESGGEGKTEFFHGEGCNFCANTGYSDRIGVYELLRVTPEIKRLIVGWATQEELRRLAVNQGMRTLRDQGISLINDDVTTIAEVIRSIYVA